MRAGTGEPDLRAPETTATTVTADTAGRQPRTGLEKTLGDVWSRVLGVPVGMDDNFFDLGGDSLLAAELVASVETGLGVRLPRRGAAEFPTVRRMARWIATRTPEEAAEHTLVRFSSGGGRPALFCVHGMGGHVLVLGRLARRLEHLVEMYGFESVGRTDAARGDRTVPAMAARYLRHLRRVQPRGPYLLGGYSMGGAVALEMAATLAAEGEQVDHVLLFDCDLRPPDILAIRARAVEFVSRALGIDPPVRAPYHELAAAAAEICRRAGGAGLTPHEVSRFAEIYLENAEALAGYVPAPYGGDMTLVHTRGGTGDGARGAPGPETYGWGPYAAGGRLRAVEVPGDHWTLFSTHVRELAEVCEAVLGPAIGPTLPRSS
ncbi:thioesterase domain-containing protein [Streptomyces sp. NPDC046215]|uniref:Carrier domain-containing protein n=1 Tax=Streptomyces stramineus TaxID=173861 RepID=A0ABP3JSN6_9ACTN